MEDQLGDIPNAHTAGEDAVLGLRASRRRSDGTTTTGIALQAGAPTLVLAPSDAQAKHKHCDDAQQSQVVAAGLSMRAAAAAS